jgi:hypothetical protein
MIITNSKRSPSRFRKSSISILTGSLVLAGALALPSQAIAALTDFSLTWTNKNNPADSFSGVLGVDSAVFPISGVLNLANTAATLSVTVPQIGGATYTMADFAVFNVGITKATASNFSVGQNLMSPNLVGRAEIFGKSGSAAFNNFNGCDNGFGVCFNRFGSGPVYNLSSMTVMAPVPEPETYSMMALGLGMMGVVARRRKQKGR